MSCVDNFCGLVSQNGNDYDIVDFKTGKFIIAVKSCQNTVLTAFYDDGCADNGAGFISYYTADFPPPSGWKSPERMLQGTKHSILPLCIA